MQRPAKLTAGTIFLFVAFTTARSEAAARGVLPVKS